MLLTEYDEKTTMQLFKEEGLEEGLEKGRKETNSQWSKLVNKLASQNRLYEISRAVADPIYLDELFRQYGLL